MKKQFFVSIALLIGLCGFGCNAPAANNVMQLQLSDTEITLNGATVSEDENQAVYRTVQSTYDEGDEANQALQDNTVLHITQGGTYQLSGSIHDAQICINAPEQDVTLRLENANITCQTAPAILVENASDPQQAGAAGVTITLAQDSVNQIYGSHIAKHTDENGNTIKNDGAISSNVSLLINGQGALQVTGDKEGIESKLHLTIDGGTIQVTAHDDALNASEDGQSVITINDGIINCSVQNGEEGDGIDSNGFIYINGGFVVAQAHSSSQDSGLDSDLGVIINGGTVCATGNMYEEISDESAQPFAQFYFADRQQGNVPLVLTDADGNYLLAYTPVNDYSILEFSSPELKDGQVYYLYRGGTLTGTITNGIYTEVEHYTGGTQLSHRGAVQTIGKPQPPQGQPPEQFPQKDDGVSNGVAPSDKEQPHEGQPPNDRTESELPSAPPDDGEKPADAPTPPTDGAKPDKAPRRPGTDFDESAEPSTEFVVSNDTRIYRGIAPLEN